MKRQLSLVVSLLVLAVMVFSLAACNTEKKHEHTYGETWSSDSTSHWKNATCSDNDECKSATAEFAAHSFNGDSCSVCGYTKTVKPVEHIHSYSSSWTSDETHHWHAAYCTGADDCATAVSDKAEHAFVDGKCVCGKEEAAAADGTEANPFAFTVPGTVTVSYAENADPVWYAFTATETKTVRVVFSAGAVMGYYVDGALTYTENVTSVDIDVVAGTTYAFNFSTADFAAAEIEVVADYIEYVFATAESIAGTYYIRTSGASGGLTEVVINADGTIVSSGVTYNFTIENNVTTVTINGYDVSAMMAIHVSDINGEVTGFLWNGNEYPLATAPTEDDDDEGDTTGPLDTENSTLVVGENTITVTDEDIETQCIEHTIVVTAEGTFSFSSNNLMVQIVTNYGPQQGEVYLMPGTYTVNVVTAYVTEAGDYALTLNYTAPASGDAEGTEENPIEIDLPAEDLAVEGDSINFIWYTFTTTDAGMITITYSNANSWVSLKNVDDPEDSISGYSKQTLVFNVQANSTYILGLGVWDAEDDVTATVTLGEGSVEPDGSSDYPFVIDGFPYSANVTLDAYGTVYYTFVAPANGYVTVNAVGENLGSVIFADAPVKESKFVVLAGETCLFYFYNEGDAVSFEVQVTFEEATLTADDYKNYLTGTVANDEFWNWSISFNKTEDGTYYAKVEDGMWSSVYFYDYSVVFNADGSVAVTLNNVIDPSAFDEANIGDEYVLANNLNVFVIPGEYGYVLLLEATPVDESELSGTGAKADPYVIPESGLYAFADVNAYPGKAISFTADKDMVIKFTADVAELWTLSFGSKLAGAGETYEKTLAAGETFSCYVCMESGVADVKVTVEISDPVTDDEGDDEEDDTTEGTVYYGTDGWGNSPLTVIVGNGTVTFKFVHEFMGNSEATFLYVLVDGAVTLYADGVAVNPYAAGLTIDENGVATSAVYNGNNYTLSLNKPGESGGDEDESNTLVVGENEVVVQNTQMGDTYSLPVNADATVTYVLTVGSNAVIVNGYDVYMDAGDTVEITVPAGETVTVDIGAYVAADPTAIVVVAVKETAAPEEEGGNTPAGPTGTESDPFIVDTVGEVKVNGYHDVYIKYTATKDCTIEFTYPAGCYVYSGLPSSFVREDISKKVYKGDVKAGDTFIVNVYTSSATAVEYVYTFTEVVPPTEVAGQLQNIGDNEITLEANTYVVIPLRASGSYVLTWNNSDAVVEFKASADASFAAVNNGAVATLDPMAGAALKIYLNGYAAGTVTLTVAEKTEQEEGGESTAADGVYVKDHTESGTKVKLTVTGATATSGNVTIWRLSSWGSESTYVCTYTVDANGNGTLAGVNGGGVPYGGVLKVNADGTLYSYTYSGTEYILEKEA